MSLPGCAAAIVLLLDASNSIQEDAWKIQVEAHADALVSEGVVRAIERSQTGIAVRVLAFNDEVTPLTQWRVLQTEADARVYAQMLLKAERPFGWWTYTHQAIDRAIGELTSEVPCEPDLRVIDIATDGNPTSRPATRQARDRAAAEGIRINAIGVGMSERNIAELREDTPTPGGFVVEAAEWSDFALRLRMKMTLEITGRTPDANPG